MLLLLQGKTVHAVVREGVIYEDIGRSKNALYTMLMTTGYLTVISKMNVPSGLFCTLAIPNLEVRDAFLNCGEIKM